MALKSLSYSVFLTLAASAAAQIDRAPSSLTPRDADVAIRDLQGITKQLGETLKLFNAHSDEAIARFDGAAEAKNDAGHEAAADFDLGGIKSVGARRDGVRKLVVARMRAARIADAKSSALSDISQIQDQLVEARKSIDAADLLIKRSLVVSVEDLGKHKDMQWQTKHDQLLRARNSAQEAAKKVILALPVDLPAADTPLESKDEAWSIGFLSTGSGSSTNSGRPPDTGDPTPALPKLSLSWERNRRITLVRERSYRIALTDPGIEDSNGRHIFYQEEWIAQGSTIERRRWRVGVDTATGQNVLIKRYPLIEYHGDFDEAYETREGDHLWTLEPPENSVEPAQTEVESALDGIAGARQRLQDSVQDFGTFVRAALLENDSMQDSNNQAVPDAAFAPALREKLFAIRAHLAGVPSVQAAEGTVEVAIRDLEDRVNKIESLAAWANRASSAQVPALKLSAAEWDALETRADRELDLSADLHAAVATALPPSLSQTQGKFPALGKDLIVHIVRLIPEGLDPAHAVRCRQEIWRFTSSNPDNRKVERVVSLVGIDPSTGTQRLLRAVVRDYNVRPDDLLESIFDQYSAQEIAGVSQEH